MLFFCAKFIELLHLEDTPFFNTVQYLTEVIGTLVPSFLICATEQEARRMGVMLVSSFMMINNWTSSEDSFKRYCDKEGFRRFLDKEPDKRISLKEFSTKFIPHIYELWTSKYLFLLNSDNPTYIRNTLILLTGLGSYKVYPKYKKHLSSLMVPISKLKEDKLENIKVMAVSYYGILSNIEGIAEEIPTSITAATPAPSSALAAKSPFSKGSQTEGQPVPPPLPSEPQKEKRSSLNPNATPFTPPRAPSPHSRSPALSESTRSERRESTKQETPSTEELRMKVKKSMKEKEEKKDVNKSREISMGRESPRSIARDSTPDQQGIMRRDRNGHRSRDQEYGDSRASHDSRDIKESRDSRDSKERASSKPREYPRTSEREYRERDHREREYKDRKIDSDYKARGTKREREEDQFSKDREKRRREEQRTPHTPREETSRSREENIEDSSSKKDRVRIKRPEIK